MIRRWKMKKTRATGTVMSAAAASLSGYWLPWDSWPEASWATPLVSVVSSGLWVDTMKWFISFQEPWNERITMVMSAGVAIGSTIDQKVRKVLAHEYLIDQTVNEPIVSR